MFTVITALPNNGLILRIIRLNGHNCHNTTPSLQRNSTNQRGPFIVVESKLEAKVVAQAFATPEFTNSEKVVLDT